MPESRRIEQTSLFTGLPQINTLVISRRRDFESLFDGFARMRAISYVVSPTLLLDFFTKNGYTEVEMIVGENMTEATCRQTLEKEGVDAAEPLAEKVASGSLRILIPERTVHTKLYILEKGDLTRRVIQTSANLTETAHQAARQVNYAWYADLPRDDPFLQQTIADYEAHRAICSPFMSDLIELIQQHRDMPRREIIETWLKGEPVEETGSAARMVLNEISWNSLRYPVTEEPVLRVQLPEASAARKQTEKLLKPLQPVITRNEIQLNRLDYIRYVERNYRFPLMRLDMERGKVLLGIGGDIETRSEEPPDGPVVNDALEHLETYLNSVDYGKSPDPALAKTSMFEALLYMLSSPFASEHMKIKRQKLSLVDKRGPQFLYVYGLSQNGKSTFLRFALKLLTGHEIQTLPGGDFTKRGIVAAMSIGSVFPLVFDDLVPAQRPGVFEQILKNYWEVWWDNRCVCPQIIMASNTYNLKEWAKSRLKRVDFDVQFVPTAQDKEKLNQIIARKSPFFKWFSWLYLRGLATYELSEDELQLARTTTRELYDRAKRPLPPFFPSEPIEKRYDPGLRAWREAQNLRKMKVSYEKQRALAEFSADIQSYEVREYASHLPQMIKHRRRGNTLIIENPADFRVWMDGKPQAGRSLLDRIKRSIRL